MNRRQEPFTRGRDNPCFQGMRRGNAVLAGRTKSGILDFQERHTSRVVSRSTSDIGDRQPRKIDSDLTNVSEITYSSLENSSEGVVHEPQERSLPEKWLKVSKPTTYPSPTTPSDSSIGIEEENELAKELSSTASESEAAEECQILTVPSKHIVERSYSVNKNRTNISGIPLPPSASSFYNVLSPKIEIVESCESLNKLNQFLKARREDVNAGVPEKFLHVVMGQDLADAGSVASTIMYAFYLNETLKNSQLCTLPVINMKRADLNSYAEVKWLLDSCDVDLSSLIFSDEIDLSYYHLFGSLKLVLLDGDRLPAKQESLKEALIEIFNCKKGDPSFPWVQKITLAQDCSCSTLISEKFVMTSPQMLAGRRFSRLLLAGILMDTGNLSNSKCTSKDKYMATLLINGAGRFGCNGLYQILRYKMYDISNLKVGDILRKDFKKWTRVGKADMSRTRLMVSHIGMSSVGISIEQLLAHDDNSVQEINNFQQSEKLRLLMVVSGYYDSQKNFKREILVSAESAELMRNLLNFFNTHSSQLPLKVWHLPGLREEMKAFEIDKVTSRKTIERLLEEFGGTSRKIK